MTSTIPIILERDNVNDESVTLVQWLVAHGELVEVDTLLAEVETSKANVEVHSPARGYLVQLYREGADVPVSAAIGQIVTEPPSVPAAQLAAAKAASTVATVERSHTSWPDPRFSPAGYKQRISPVAVRMIAEKGISVSVFTGLSVVRKQDVLDYLYPPEEKPASAAPSRAAALRTSINQPYQQTQLSRMKRSEGANLAAGMGNAVASAVTVTSFTRGLRQILASTMNGGNPFAVFVYEVSRLLRKYPTLNATYSDGHILKYEQVNVGFAMDDGRGLKVATIPDCDQLSLQDIDGCLRDLTVAYLSDRLTVAQISNATFIVSDLSGLGVSSFMPLISENQGGILGIGGEQFAPGAEYGFFTMTLTFDHQLSNGRIAALFLNDLKERLRNYETAQQRPEEARQQAFCSQCFRPASELRKVNHYLLVSAEPEGCICTICAMG
ncbi:MAG: 2-oxo acid dehydrogenase subunit E2 [Terracidiphilus sp.]